MKLLGLPISLLLFFWCISAQEILSTHVSTTAVPIHNVFTSFNISNVDGVTPTPLVYNISGESSNIRNMTTTVNGSVTFTLSYLSPSPTSFIFTHYPTHTKGLNTSAVSSMRPSQSAPLPDDTIGKYGHLHVSSAPKQTLSWLLLSFCIYISHCRI
jgi:hypothetical protein